MNVQQANSENWLFLNIPKWITISLESSRRDLFIGMVVGRFVFKYNQITFSTCFAFIRKKSVSLPKTGMSFYSEFRVSLNFASITEGITEK